MNKKILRKRVLCAIVCLAVALSGIMFPTNYAKAAETEVAYYDWDEETKALVKKTIAKNQCVLLVENTTQWIGAEGGTWYYLNQPISIEERITVQGEVHLILGDECSLKADKGISVNADDNNSNKLYIHSQSLDEDTMGRLVAAGEADITGWNVFAGIGGDDGKGAGTIVINGGILDVDGGHAAAIGGGHNGDGGTVTINGGKIEAWAYYGAAIGGGYNDFEEEDANVGNGGIITINGGTIAADSGYQGAAIGGGCYGAGETITINGGSIEATAVYGAGIGGGNTKSPSSDDSRQVEKDSGNITISGGTIKTESYLGAGIGGGSYGDGKTITIKGGTIEATSTHMSAGIGGGYCGDSGVITIQDEAKITAVSDAGAGVGSGVEGNVNSITVDGGEIQATAVYGAGIGNGEKGNGGTVAIKAGTVNAKSSYGAGIGSGYCGYAGTVTIEGGIITSESNKGAGIGGAHCEEGDGTVNIKAGTITSKSTYGAGIGNGENVGGVVVNISGGNILADSQYGDKINSGSKTDEEVASLYEGIRTITLCGMTEQTAIESVDGLGKYGVKDVVTFDNNKLYFYLPEFDGFGSITADDSVYEGKIKSIEKEASFHNYVYTKADNKLVATCKTEDCVSYEVTLNKPSDTEYTGEAIEAKVVVSSPDYPTPEIKYVANQGSLTDGKPVNEGSYTAKVTLGDHTIKVDYDITKTVEDPVEPENPVDPENPENPDVPDPIAKVDVSYKTHVQSIGWQDAVKNGAMSGTEGKAKRLEGIEVSVDTDAELGIQYTTHCQSYGWLPWSADGDMSGTTGEAKRLEAIMIKLTGADAEKYDVYYRVHAQSYGWLDWAKDGEPAGTAGYGKRLEGIQIVIVEKDASFDKEMGDIKSVSDKAFEAKEGKSPIVNNEATSNEKPVVPGENMVNVSYRTHVQTYGWQGWKYNGAMSGTTGEAKRLEGIEINLSNKDYDGGISYCTHVQTYGWQGADLKDSSTWKKDGQMAGTSGEAKRLEAICITLTGEMAEHYDVYYRVHAQSYGWLGWAKNGDPSGTAGYAKRLEGIQVVLVPKDGEAPANNFGGISSANDRSYIEK